MNDKQVKEKMERLDALSGGVVFGKEEAWDKLQARMDAKPARKMVWWFRLAAAAILLLCVSIAALYYTTPEKQIAATQPQPAVIQNNIPGPEQTPAMAAVPAEPKKTTVHSLNNSGREKPVKFVIQEQQTPHPTLPVDTATTQPAIAVITQPTPAKPTFKKMRVVHINDLSHYEAEPNYAATYTAPSLDIRRMKVVSLYDLQNEERLMLSEQEMITLVRINKPHGMFTLPGPINRGTSYDRSFTQNPLSIKFN